MKLIENGNLFNPNVCLICEEQPSGDNVIDCEHVMPVSPLYPLNGRKYVCFRCAAEFAKLIGFTSADHSSELQAELDQANYVLANVKQRTSELASRLFDFTSNNAEVDVDSEVADATAEVTPASAAIDASATSTADTTSTTTDPAPASTTNTTADPTTDPAPEPDPVVDSGSAGA